MKKTVSFVLAVIMLAAAAVTAFAAAQPPFDDVSVTRWSCDSIVYAVREGYMNGVGGNRFSPSGTLTRAMVATVLWRRQGEPKPAAPSGFSDVPAGKWYSDAVAWAKETGVVNGTSEVTFEPDAFITREQLDLLLLDGDVGGDLLEIDADHSHVLVKALIGVGTGIERAFVVDLCEVEIRFRIVQRSLVSGGGVGGER